MDGDQSWIQKLWESISSLIKMVIRNAFRIHSTNNFHGYPKAKSG